MFRVDRWIGEGKLQTVCADIILNNYPIYTTEPLRLLYICTSYTVYIQRYTVRYKVGDHRGVLLLRLLLFQLSLYYIHCSERSSIVVCRTYRGSAAGRKRERNLRRLWFSLTEPTTMDVIWETSAREPAAVPRETTTRPRGEQSTRLHTQTHSRF